MVITGKYKNKNKIIKGYIDKLPENKKDNKIYWHSLSKYNYLDEKFIIEYADKFNWKDLSRDQKLSEKFIAKYSDKLDWKNICIHQKLSC